MEEKRGFKAFLCSGIGKACMIMAMYAVILLLIVLCTNSNVGWLVIGIGLLCAVFGWKALNVITPNVFLIMPIGGWVIYCIVKGVLAVIIGMFVTPFVVAKKIIETVQEGLETK